MFVNKELKHVFDALILFKCLVCEKGKGPQTSQDKTANNNTSPKKRSNIKDVNLDKEQSRGSPDLDEDLQGLTTVPQISNKVFRNVLDLKNHLYYIHKLKLCDLCLTHNNLFSFEYSYYDKKELIKHMNQGEKNTSHKGHPTCQLCQGVFFNQDELLFHMARDHYHCHFCARSSSNFRVYFSDYSSLREHFKSHHYLCEKGNCRNEQFTSAFEHDIDYQMHLVRVHGNPSASLRGSEARQQRTIVLESAPYRNNRSESPSQSIRRTLPTNAVYTTVPVAVANSSIENRANVRTVAQQETQRQVLSAEFPSLINPTLQTSNRNNTNTPNSRSASASTSAQLVAGSFHQNSASFVSRAGGRPSSSQIAESDFPPLPNQKSSKQKSTKKVAEKESRAKQAVNNRQPTNLDQLFANTLSLSAQNGSRKGGQKRQRPLKLQLS